MAISDLISLSLENRKLFSYLPVCNTWGSEFAKPIVGESEKERIGLFAYGCDCFLSSRGGVYNVQKWKTRVLTVPGLSIIEWYAFEWWSGAGLTEQSSLLPASSPVRSFDSTQINLQQVCT